MQPRTSNGWTNPCDSVQSPIWRLGDCKHLQEGRSYAASSQSHSREYPTVPRILRDELVAGDHSWKHNARVDKWRECSPNGMMANAWKKWVRGWKWKEQILDAICAYLDRCKITSTAVQHWDPRIVVLVESEVVQCLGNTFVSDLGVRYAWLLCA